MEAGGVPRRLRGHEPPRGSVRSVSRMGQARRILHSLDEVRGACASTYYLVDKSGGMLMRSQRLLS